MLIRTILVACAAALGLGLTYAVDDRMAAVAAPSACTGKQKKQRQLAVTSYKKRMPKDRAAYYRKHKSKKLRAAYVKKQQARLKALQKSLAACSKKAPPRTTTVPPRTTTTVPTTTTTSPSLLADVSITMGAAGANRLTFTAIVRNAGPAQATEVRFRDALPAGVTFESVTASQGSCTGGATVTCDLASLAASAEATITIAAWQRGGTSTNTATVEASSPDPNAGNNSVAASFAVPALAPPSSGPSCTPALVPGNVSYSFHLGPTDYSQYLRAAGTVNVLMLFVDFPDAPASEPTQPIYDALAPAWAQWYGQASFGRFAFSTTPRHGWLRMPKAASAYELDYRDDTAGFLARQKAYLAAAITLVDPVVDFHQYSVVLLVPSASAGFTHTVGYAFPVGAGVAADGVEVRGGVTMAPDTQRRPDILVHESGHLFGLPDMYQRGVPYEEGTRYLGRWEPMSRAGSLSHFLGWVKWKLGWLDPTEVRCLAGAGSLEETISPVETAGGVKMIVLPTGSATAELVEVHTLRGISNEVCDAGVLVYAVDVRLSTGEAGARIMPAQTDAGDAGTNLRCGPGNRAAFDVGPGEVAGFEDAVMKVEVLATDGSAFRVRVTRK